MTSSSRWSSRCNTERQDIGPPASRGWTSGGQWNERSEAFGQCCDAGANYGLILVDLDVFKSINDKFGHQAQDDVLQVVGRILRDELRDRSDIAARLGGDEFAVLCFDHGTESGLCRLAERIRSKVGKETNHDAARVPDVHLQFRGRDASAADESFKDIYLRSDHALYDAKAGGRDRVVYRDASVPAKSPLSKVKGTAASEMCS